MKSFMQTPTPAVPDVSPTPTLEAPHVNPVSKVPEAAIKPRDGVVAAPARPTKRVAKSSAGVVKRTFACDSDVADLFDQVRTVCGLDSNWIFNKAMKAALQQRLQTVETAP